jgi:hypothetical protein
VLVELAPEARGGAGDYYGEHMAHGERLFRRYSEEQLTLLLEFTREGRELNEREAAKLEARMRGEPGT